MSNWKVPRMWEGQTVAVLASGESMNASIAEQLLGKVQVITINNTFQLAPWADLIYAADARWWDVHRKEVLKKDGLKVSISETQYSEVLKLHNSGPVGFDPNPANLRTGSHSGYQAVHLAIHTGASRILLCGYDMHGKHWHPEHKTPLRTTDKDRYPIWVTKYSELKKEMPKQVEIINCTLGSAIKCFPFAELSEVLNEGQLCLQFA